MPAVAAETRIRIQDEYIGSYNGSAVSLRLEQLGSPARGYAVCLYMPLPEDDVDPFRLDLSTSMTPASINPEEEPVRYQHCLEQQIGEAKGDYTKLLSVGEALVEAVRAHLEERL